MDRRRKPRISDPFPAKVQGIDINGDRFEVETVIDNLSAGGMYLKLMRQLERGAKISVVFQLSIDAAAKVVSKARVAVKGEVLRSESKPGGACGLAITFNRARFIHT